MVNNNNPFVRTEYLTGDRAVRLLHNTKIIVFGLGGVGSYVVEALARCNTGTLALVDCDTISYSNINRQLFALESTVGKKKTEVAKERLLDISHEICVQTFDLFYDKTNCDVIDLREYDYVVDAIDTVSSKLLLIERAKAFDIPIISCMGTGNKLDPSKFEIGDISDTSICPLARVMRRELKGRGITNVKVLFSKEKPVKNNYVCAAAGKKSPIPGSISFVPPVAGMMIAGEVVRDLLHKFGYI